MVGKDRLEKTCKGALPVPLRNIVKSAQQAAETSAAADRDGILQSFRQRNSVNRVLFLPNTTKVGISDHRFLDSLPVNCSWDNYLKK